MRGVCWVDGEIVSLDQPVVRGDDSAFAFGLGCYTSARVENGRVRFVERHIQRLIEGARSLRLGDLSEATIRQAFSELAKAAFGDGDGVVRLQVSRDGRGALHLTGVPRPIGEEPAEWKAMFAPVVHDGAELSGGLKVTSRLTLTLAFDAARRAGVEEALLLDGADRLVEGAGSNIFVVTADGVLATPPLPRGAVAGISRTLVLERVPEVVERDVSKADLFVAREIIAVNAVRGARPITLLDDRPVGDRAGPWAARLREELERA